MTLDVIIDDNSTTVEIGNPYKYDLNAVVSQISRFASSKGADISRLDVGSLIPQMIRGVAGCEHGCPSNAKDLVSRGFGNFDLQYIEGGILSARAPIGTGKFLSLKMFPDF